MSDFSRVLCAIDLTEPSRRALDCALWWARQHGADVSVLHVHRLALLSPDTMSGDTGSGVPAQAPIDATLTEAERQAQQLEVENFVDGSRTDGLQIEVLLDQDPSVADAIVTRADALAADLIVVGAGTGAPSEHPALGPVTAEVLGTALCSVLVIPPPAPDVVNPCVAGLDRIMCAVNLSDESRPILASAASLATESSAHLTVVHVVELSEVAAVAYDFDAHREARVQPARDELVELVADVVGLDKPAEEILAQGNAGQEILKLAAEESTGLLVLGRASERRTPGTGRPTGHTVAREARCPVLFVHADMAATRARYPIGFEESRPSFDSQA